jgi:hypothetical protein
LVELWDNAEELVEDKVVIKVVDEVWTHVGRNSRAFHRWVFTCLAYTTHGFYVLFSMGDRDERTFGDIKPSTARG